MLTFEEVKNNFEMHAYFNFASKAFFIKNKKYLEHNTGHALYAAKVARYILKSLGYDRVKQEYAAIAAYIHDIGNIISKDDYDQSSALLFLNIIREDISNDDILGIISAVGSHEDILTEVIPLTPITAALILGDKTDVRSERVVINNLSYYDRYFTVMEACQSVNVFVNKEEKIIELRIKVDTKFCSVMDYFEICTSRISYCIKASGALGCIFELYINKDKFL
jgi:hypothetical protein